MDYIALMESMIGTGQPPVEACSDFGVGYEEAFSRLKKTYLERFFKRGQSAEKFIVGPYGSGKTHFVRQLLEVAEDSACAVAEIQLSRSIEIDNSLIIHKEIAREIRLPGNRLKGISNLLRGCVERVRIQYDDPDMQDKIIESWLEAIELGSFESDAFRRVLLKTLNALIKGDKELFNYGVTWLSGEVSNRSVCNILAVNPVSAKEQKAFGRRATFSLCQFIRSSGYSGTVLGFDEAEQAANVGSRLRERILSMARSEIDAVSRLQNGSLLILYAFTPDVVQEMKNYPALQQRISEPDPSHRFFDGNDYSPIIDLAQPYNNADRSIEMLEKIGNRLVNLFISHCDQPINLNESELQQKVKKWAKDTFDRESSIRNRRDMVKLTCSRLIHLYYHGIIDENQPLPVEQAPDDEV